MPLKFGNPEDIHKIKQALLPIHQMWLSFGKREDVECRFCCHFKHNFDSDHWHCGIYERTGHAEWDGTDEACGKWEEK